MDELRELLLEALPHLRDYSVHLVSEYNASDTAGAVDELVKKIETVTSDGEPQC